MIALFLTALLQVPVNPGTPEHWQGFAGLSGPQVPLEFVDLSNYTGMPPLESNQTYSGKLWFNGQWTGLHHYYEDGPCDNVVVRDCKFLSAQKWASRSYRMRKNILVERVHVDDVETEHGFYWNMAGLGGPNPTGQGFAAMWKDCLWTNIGSQAIQLVYRDWETPEPVIDNTPGGMIWLLDCRGENVGFNLSGNARAAYAFSFFYSQNDVTMLRVSLNNLQQDQSRGAVFCEGPNRSMLMVNCDYQMGICDRPIAKFENLDNLIIRNSLFTCRPGITDKGEPGRQKIEINNCQSIRIEGCVGNVEVWVNGQNLGSVVNNVVIP